MEPSGVFERAVGNQIACAEQSAVVGVAALGHVAVICIVAEMCGIPDIAYIRPYDGNPQAESNCT